MKWNERCKNCEQPKMFLKQKGKWVHANTLEESCAGKSHAFCQ